MSFANVTSGIHGDFYYANLGDNSNNCNTCLQEIIKFGRFVSVFYKKCIMYRHILPIKHNKLFYLFNTFTLREMSYLVYSVPPMTRCK